MDWNVRLDFDVAANCMPIVLQLLDEDFPVTAFVHKADQRSERLKAKGADIVVGSLTDINDMRTAVADATRAYFCVPNTEALTSIFLE